MQDGDADTTLDALMQQVQATAWQLVTVLHNLPEMEKVSILWVFLRVGEVCRVEVCTHRRHVVAAGRQLADLEPHEQVVLGVQVRGAAGRGHGGGAPLRAAHGRGDGDGGRQHAPRRSAPAHSAVLLGILPHQHRETFF